MALDGLSGIGNFNPQLNKQIKMPQSWEKQTGPAFGGIKGGGQEYGQSIGEKPFDWHSLAKFDNKPPTIGGVGADNGNLLNYFA